MEETAPLDEKETSNILIDNIRLEGIGTNQALDFCLPLLLLACRLSKVSEVSEDYIPSLRETMVNDILSISGKLSTLKIYEELDITRLRYCLCVFIDEMVLKNDVFISSYYANNTLSSRLFNESSGGDKFFGIMSKWLENPAKNKDMLEFIYACLVLGYRGKFGLEYNGSEKIIYLCENIASALTPTINSSELAAFDMAYKGSCRDSFWNRHGSIIIKTILFIIPVTIIIVAYIINFVFIDLKDIETASFLKTKIETINLNK